MPPVLTGLAPYYEKHHGLTYNADTIKAAAHLSDKYINDRFLPDKAIDVIDETGAYLRLKGAGKRKKVSPKDIEKIVAKIAKVPVTSVTSTDKANLESLPKRLFKVFLDKMMPSPP